MGNACFSLLNNLKILTCSLARTFVMSLHYLMDNIFIRYGSKLFRQIVGIPFVTYCIPLVADLFLFYYERDSILSLSEADVVKAIIDGWLRMGLLPPPPPMEFCRHILSCRELKAATFKR